ncbi:uncharacterized protein CcaverHIS019_0207490 [Cutaneotrichosporon cavernicola]|uniref:Methyltransferase domain-containing protein n=1 Tax=Cutaneotrichosporon cavernicola TaxID=279322 RepID=A0AA48IAT9_9TREE|nr:uncharacterized protein CcaverHIS019_0207490 [Cutaneotrichosporon cavernicola]BEI89387.1 hypothetical protein CcaverHIS019_0207490 [Cutaneotrichosporon cavernicola]
MPPLRTDPALHTCEYCQRRFKKQGFLNRHLLQRKATGGVLKLTIDMAKGDVARLPPQASTPKPKGRRGRKKKGQPQAQSATEVKPNTRVFLYPFATGEVGRKGGPVPTVVNLCTPSPPPNAKMPGPRWRTDNQQAIPGPSHRAPPEENTWFNQRPPPLNPTPPLTNEDFLRRRRRYHLTTDSPSLAPSLGSVSNSREGSVASGHSRSSTSSRRSRQKRKRLYAVNPSATHTRFESSDEVCHDKQTAVDKPPPLPTPHELPSPACRDDSQNGDAFDLDAISLPSRLGSPSPSPSVSPHHTASPSQSPPPPIDEPPSQTPSYSQRYPARCSTYNSGGSVKPDPATTFSDDRDVRMEDAGKDEELSAVESQPPVRKRHRHVKSSSGPPSEAVSNSQLSPMLVCSTRPSMKGRSSPSRGSIYASISSEEQQSEVDDNRHRKARRGKGKSNSSPLPTDSNLERDSATPESARWSHYSEPPSRRQSLHSPHAILSSPTHNTEPTTPNDDDGSAVETYSVQTTTSAARRHSIDFNAAAVSESLQGFLEHAQKIHQPVFHRSRLVPDKAGPVRPTNPPPRGTAPPRIVSSAPNASLTVTDRPQTNHNPSLLTAATERVREERPQHSPEAPTSRALSPSIPPAPTPGAPPLRAAITSLASAAPNPFLRSPTATDDHLIQLFNLTFGTTLHSILSLSSPSSSTSSSSPHPTMTSPTKLASCSLHDPRLTSTLVPQLAHRLNLADAWGILPGWQVLDVGCGSGDSTLAFAQAVGSEGHVTGIDPGSLDEGSPTLSQAQGYILRSRLGPRISFKQADTPSFLASGGSFDAATLCHSLWYFDSRATVRRLFQALANGNVKRVLLAEYTGEARTEAQEPHALAAQVQVQFYHAQARGEGEGPILPGVREALRPAEIVREAQEAGWRVANEGVLQSPEGMVDGKLAVQGVLDPAFTARLLSFGVRGTTADMLGMVQEIRGMKDDLMREGEDVDTMDVAWVVLEKA